MTVKIVYLPLIGSVAICQALTQEPRFIYIRNILFIAIVQTV